MPTRKTKAASAPAARFGGGDSSVSVRSIKSKPAPEPRVISQKERDDWAQAQRDEHELQQRAVVPGGDGGGPQVLVAQRFGGKSYDKPEPPKLTAKEKKALAEAKKAKQQEREVVAAYDAKQAAEREAKRQVQAAIEQEQAEKARLAHEERYRAMWGDRGGASVLLRRDSPSFKGKR